MQSLVLLNGGILPGMHRPMVIQWVMASAWAGPLLRLGVCRPIYARSLSKVFGPTTQPSTEEMDAYWGLTAHKGGHLNSDLVSVEAALVRCCCSVLKYEAWAVCVDSCCGTCQSERCTSNGKHACVVCCVVSSSQPESSRPLLLCCATVGRALCVTVLCLSSSLMGQATLCLASTL